MAILVTPFVCVAVGSGCRPGVHPASNELTRELLGWQPTHHGLITDLEDGHYFNTPSG